MGIPVFYIPLLHRELAPSQTPPTVIFFPAGLKEEAPRAPHAADPAGEQARDAVRKALPLNAGEARNVLAELLRLGNDLSGTGDLLQMAAREAFGTEAGFSSGVPFAQRADERAALEAFAATGEVPAENPAGVAVSPWAVPGNSRAKSPDVWPAPGIEAAPDALQPRHRLVDCQKALLLAHAQEENTLEILRAEERLRKAEVALEESLGGEEDEELAALLADSDAGAVPDDAAAEEGEAEHGARATSGLPSWRTVLEAMSPFFPEPCVLFTADEAMARDLRDAGMLEPLPEDRAALCADWPGALVAGLLWTALPVWKLAGRRGPAAERPWLARTLEVLVARPAGGWQEDAHRKGNAGERP